MCVWLTVDVVEASGLKFVLKIIASISMRVVSACVSLRQSLNLPAVVSCDTACPPGRR